MAWNWQIPGWPEFRYDEAALAPLEQRFLMSSGEVLGAVHHVNPSERDQLRIDLLSDEAMKTSAIEGEMLDRRSVQSSLRRHLGLDSESYPNKPRERGVAEMMVDVYSTFAEPLEHGTLFRWHEMLLVVRSQRLHPRAAPPCANVAIIRTTSNIMILVDLLIQTFDLDGAADGVQMSESIH